MNRIVQFTFVAFIVVTAVVSAAISDPVKIDTGLIEGTSNAGSEVRVFKGIPFAAPPVGPLRWRPPQPVASWTGVRNTEDFGPRCMQGGAGGARGGAAPAPTSEDCLYLNVWTGAKSASERRPVIVFAYGGGL